MFWKYNAISSSQTGAALAREDITLQELMDEEDIINECKVENKLLMEFLTKPAVMDELVTLTTTEPSLELDVQNRFKYSNIACEILTCDVPSINERLAGDPALLAKFYSFLETEAPLNPLLASFFSKILSVLIAKKTEQHWLSFQFTCLQVLDFLKARDNFILLLLKHMGTSAIMDLTFKLMTQVKGPDVRQNIVTWLDSEQIIQSLVSLLNPTVDKDRHSNVAQLLCDFIKITRDTIKNSNEKNEPDVLLSTLESSETVSLLLKNILGNVKSESCIVGGIQVLLALLDVNKASIDDSVDLEYKQNLAQNVVNPILLRLSDFHELLIDPPKKSPVVTTTGVLDPPLGNTRLHVTKLFAAIIFTENPEVLKQLISLNSLQVLLDLFFAFPWNNFLHMQVQICITSALKIHIPSETGDENALYKHLIVNCKLVERILEAWKNNDILQSASKGVRQGYMGHLMNIACTLSDMCSTGHLGQFLKDNLHEIAEKFEDFSKTTLQDAKKTRDRYLAGSHPKMPNEPYEDYSDIPFSSQSAAIHQEMYTQYQVSQLAPQLYLENYSFNDDDFNDSNDPLQNIEHRRHINFDLSEEDNLQQELFKKICAQNINTLDDADDQIFEDREQTYETVIERKGGLRSGGFSSDSDDSPPPDELFMDVDSWGSNKKSESAITPISTSSPWDIIEENASEANTGWANFSSASFANFEANFGSIDNATTDDAFINTPINDHKDENNLKVVGETVVDNNSVETAENSENSAQSDNDGLEKNSETINGDSDIPKILSRENEILTTTTCENTEITKLQSGLLTETGLKPNEESNCEN